MGKYKLVYFPVAAKGEKVRMTLAAAGIDFDDERITFEQWGALKPSIPSRQLPALYTPCGKILSQSLAICRFLAKQHGFYSNDDWEVYYMEQMIGIYEDLFDEVIKIHFTKDDSTKASLAKDYTETKGPNGLRQIAERLIEAESKGGFLAGTAKPTLADILCVSSIDAIGKHFPDMVGQFPTVAKHAEKVVASLPKLGEYMKKRPATEF